MAQPVHISKGVGGFAPLDPERILYKEADALVLKSATATDADFQDLYVVNFSNRFALPEGIEQFGEVLGFEPARFAVMRLSLDKADALAGYLHMEGHACGVLTKLNGSPIELAPPATPVPVIPVTTRDVRVERAVAKVSSANIRTTIEALAAMQTRYHRSVSGGTVADVLGEKYEALRMGRNDVTIAPYDHGSATPQKSLVVRIEGTTRPNEVIILGSHLDSVNSGGGTEGRSPGADDNASGTATNLEIFRLVMEEGIHFERTLEIHAYAAEEIGLVGSQDIASDYKAAGKNVVAMVQHDMTLWKTAGAADKIFLVTSNTNDGFNTLLSSLIDAYTGLPWAKQALFGGSSDHASWTRAGYAASFPFENPGAYNRHIHTANDTTANANAFEQAAGFAKLGLAYAMHFGGID